MTAWFEGPDDLEEAVRAVASLPAAARAMLARLVETQGVRVAKVSPSAERLFDLGFAHVREGHDGAAVTPSLEGEEALAAWEDRGAVLSHPRR